MKFEYPVGATPLDPDETAELIPDHITTQAELNEWEQENILEADVWLSRLIPAANSYNGYAVAGSNSLDMNKPLWGYAIYGSSNSLNMDKLLDATFIQQVHRKMFGKTWRWAGKFRDTNKNIGVDKFYISTYLRQLLDDTKFQVTNQSYEIDEIAVRLHHRLVAIHPFPNGNGRHSRYIAKLFLNLYNRPEFSWGQSSLYEDSFARKQYIKALKAADQHDYSALLAFSRQ